MDEADVVGFEEPREILIDWLVKGRAERTGRLRGRNGRAGKNYSN